MAPPADLRAVAAAISADLRAAGILHAVSDSIALAAHGHVRSTLDVDILVVVPALRLPRVFDVVRKHGFDGEDKALIAALRENGVAVLRRGPTKVEILVPLVPFHDTLLPRCVWREVNGTRVPFVTAEDLVMLKLLWFRAKDVPDLYALAAFRSGPLDLGYVARTLRGVFPDDHPRLADWERIMSEVAEARGR